MPEREQRILIEVTPANYDKVDRLVQAGIEICQSEGWPLTFPTVYKSMHYVINEQSNDHVDPETKGPEPDFVFLGQEAVYAFLRKNQEKYGISIFMQDLFEILDFAAGEKHPVEYIEVLGADIFIYLPQTRRWLQESESKPIFTCLDKCERGVVGALSTHNEVRVIKNITDCNPEEVEIAIHLGEKGLSPRVFESTRSLIVEEYIPDPPIRNFVDTEPPEFVGSAIAGLKRTPDFQSGGELSPDMSSSSGGNPAQTSGEDVIGIMLATLHEEGVVYDDRLYDHLLVGSIPGQGDRLRVIDLSGAHWGDDFIVDWENAKGELERYYYKPGSEAATVAVEALRSWIEPEIGFSDELPQA